ncbi:hypothetical protein [Parasitella parasitica]|uniref:F-box domain-containing protein n=1 Tax=Parasitella parasitica TaxID=35722 RepID=A0A0B7N0I7_9FUNG|nr:hypothetical protein [Parasitella parasitica]
MGFPAELIELIAEYLPNHQQYKCLTLSRSWFKSVHRAMYKVIYIKNRHQFKLFFQIVEKKGHMVRQVYFSTCESKSKNIVGITSFELDQLATYCPYMEILDFDQKLWKYSKLPSIGKWNCIRQLPTFNIHTMSILPSMGSYRLKRLSLHGELVSTLFDQKQSSLIKLLGNIPNLQQLYINSKQSKSHEIQVSLQEMESIHLAAPSLTDLELSGSFKFIMEYKSQAKTLDAMQQIAPTHIKCLKLTATIPPQWIYYIARKYPRMQEFDIEALDSATTAFHTYKKASYPSAQLTVPSAKEVHFLFSVLINSCPELRKLEIDSTTGRRYMTETFFDTLTTHKQLKEIKLKHSTYNLVSRDQFFDLLVTKGQQVISGLGTEVIGTDLHISNILDPLSRFTRLTELVLCCGHPYFDCDINIVLGGCQQLLDLTIRSAHLMLHQPQDYHAHPLKSLHLSTVSFSAHVFDHLGKTCHNLKRLSFYECDQRDDSRNQIQINMPHNEFDLLLMNGIRLDSVPLQCHTWIPNARILSMETTSGKRWYHAYNEGSCYYRKPKIHRLNERKSAIAEHYYKYGWINNQRNLEKAISKSSKMKQSQNYLHTQTSRKWDQDLFFGCISIQCKSVKSWELICNTTYYEF